MSIYDDLKAAKIKARKERNKLLLRPLDLVLGDLHNLEIERKGKELSDADVISVLQKAVKTRQESAGIYESAGSHDKALIERGEADYLSTFIPREAPDEVYADAVQSAIDTVKPTSAKDMGKVIKEARSRMGDRVFDGKRLAGMVKAALK